LLERRNKVKKEIIETEITEINLTEVKVLTTGETTEKKLKEKDVNTNLSMSKKEVSKDKLKRVEAQILMNKFVNSEESKSKNLKMMASLLSENQNQRQKMSASNKVSTTDNMERKIITIIKLKITDE
jgi:hypothetical protein